jgi:hypothetical protein
MRNTGDFVFEFSGFKFVKNICDPGLLFPSTGRFLVKFSHKRPQLEIKTKVWLGLMFQYYGTLKERENGLNQREPYGNVAVSLLDHGFKGLT